MQKFFYVNGEFVEPQDAVVSVEDRGYQFADGVYEVTRFHGRRPLRLDDHLKRLEESAAHLHIAGAPTAEEWRAIIERLVELNGISDDVNSLTTLYQQVTRGACPRNHVFPKSPVPPGVVAYFKSAPSYTPEFRRAGVELSVQADERWDRCYIKSICLLPAILAKQAAVEAGAFEALLVRDGVVTEGGSTNVFCVIDGTVHTHPEGGKILSGITRRLVLEAAAKAGVPVVERPVTLEEYLAADEAFVASTTLDIMPVTKVDGNVIGAGVAGPVTERLMAGLGEIVRADVGAREVAAGVVKA